MGNMASVPNAAEDSRMAEQYTVTIDIDERRFARMLRTLTAQQFRTANISAVSTAILSAGVLAYSGGQSPTLGWCLGVACGAWAVCYVTARTSVRQALETMRLMSSGPTEMTVSEGGIRFVGRYSRSELAWQKFTRVAQFSDFWLLYIANSSAVFVPIEALTTPVRQLLLDNVRPLREARDRCLRCGYDLFGLIEKRCPECGYSFSMNDDGKPVAERTSS